MKFRVVCRHAASLLCQRKMRVSRLIVLLALSVSSLGATAASALAFSETADSSRNHAVATGLPMDQAKVRALADCAKITGASDCKIILATNSPGFGSMAGTCVAPGACFYSFVAGQPSKDAALDAAINKCKKDYGETSCMPWDLWQEPAVARSAGQASGPVANGAPKRAGRQSPAVDEKYLKTQLSKYVNKQPWDDDLLTDCGPAGLGFRELAFREGKMSKPLYDTGKAMCAPEMQAEIRSKASEFARRFDKGR